ncbi:MAG TPA: peptidase MA family metallohydrolase [Nitrospiria bacterium]|jgi:hypothetical protein
MEQSETLLKKITQDIGFTPGNPIGVIMASSESEFNQFQPSNRPLPSWAVGVAYPSGNVMVIRSPRLIQGNLKDTIKTFTHELCHLVLASGFEGRPIPRWLNEGLAMYESYEWRPSQDVLMARAVLSGTLIPLEDLTQAFGGNHFDVQKAYFQSYSLVHYLLSTYGPSRFRHFVLLLSKGKSFEQALQNAFDITPQAFETKWKRYLAFRFNWVPLLTSTGVLWGLITVSLIGIYFVRKRKNKEILKEWAEQEEREDENEKNQPR